MNRYDNSKKAMAARFWWLAIGLLAIVPLASATINFGEYADDANTLALYHLNQSSGSTATDDNSTGRTAHPGTLTGSPLPTWDTGLFGNGLHFGYNTANGVNMGNLMSVTANYTMEMYLNWGFVYADPVGLIVTSGGGDFLRGFLYDHGGNPALTPMGVDFLARTGDGVYHDIVTPESKALFAGQWTHVAATRSWDGVTAEWKLYVNGDLAGSYSSTLGFWDAGADVYLGTSGGGNFSYVGWMDEVRFSSVALTSFGMVPEPSLIGLAVAGGLVMLGWRRRR